MAAPVLSRGNSQTSVRGRMALDFDAAPVEDGDDDDMARRPSLSRRVSMDDYYYNRILGPGERRPPTDAPPAYDEALGNLCRQPSSREKSMPPREGDGTEALPAYSASIALEHVFMKKMELESAVHKAHDRNWYRVFVRLQGTALCIHRVKTASFFPKQSAGPTLCADLPPGKKPGDLLRTYNLQHAEVGIAADYRKRLYVIRVRVEADQFLLSCVEIETFLIWLESLCAAINLALPLDERKLPHEYTHPRSRRRRARIRERNEAFLRQQREIMRAFYPHLLEETIAEEPPASPPGYAEDDNGEAPELGATMRRQSVAAPELDAAMRRPSIVPPEADNNANDDTIETIAPAEPSLSSTEPAANQLTAKAKGKQSAVLETTAAASSSRRRPSRDADEITPAPMPSLSTFALPQVPSPPSHASASRARSSMPGRDVSETGKWQPQQTWTTMYDRLYAKRCIDVLLSKSPRKTNLVIMQGKRWFIDWATGAVTRCDPPMYGEVDLVGPWGLMPSHMISRV